jgi:hypothetical protein
MFGSGNALNGNAERLCPVNHVLHRGIRLHQNPQMRVDTLCPQTRQQYQQMPFGPCRTGHFRQMDHAPDSHRNHAVTEDLYQSNVRVSPFSNETCGS